MPVSHRMDAVTSSMPVSHRMDAVTSSMPASHRMDAVTSATCTDAVVVVVVVRYPRVASSVLFCSVSQRRSCGSRPVFVLFQLMSKLVLS